MSRMQNGKLLLGAHARKEGCEFLVWCPKAESIELHVVAPEEMILPMQMDNGYASLRLEEGKPGLQYFYRVNGKDLPDPASRYQPEGVHGPSEVVSRQFPWTDFDWKSPSLRDLILYELHVGTFTAEGTFEAAIHKLPYLRDLGITAVEVMPVNQFPGSRNWGYDGVFPFATQNTYGGPEAFKKFIQSCHDHGLAVILDVVYNHFGCEGNYTEQFAPYFTSAYQTPWGMALNFDGPESDHVRRYFIENALQWLEEFHCDGLRLDAIHAIKDFSAKPFLQELSEAVALTSEAAGRNFILIGESDLNDPRVVQSAEKGGWGLDAAWADDFHHLMHVLLTGEQSGYYMDYKADIQELAKVLTNGFYFTGQYAPSRKRRHGAPSHGTRPEQFVTCLQNHDQTGNRAHGDRLAALVPSQRIRVATGLHLLSPFTPLLFMGEEYGETAPFQYFVSCTDPDLVRAIQEGRRKEFSEFKWVEEVPDPQNEKTFQRSKLSWNFKKESNRQLLEYFTSLIRLRKSITGLFPRTWEEVQCWADGETRCLVLQYPGKPRAFFVLASFHSTPQSVALPPIPGRWKKQMDSEDARWGGTGEVYPSVWESTSEGKFELPPWSLALFEKME